MARKNSRGASKTGARAMRRRKKSTLKSGRSGRKVAQARRKGARVPRKRSSR